MAAAQHPIDPAALSEAFTEPASWTMLPSWAFVATADRSIPTELLRFIAARAGSRTVEVDSLHAVPVSHPTETAEFIVAAADSCAATSGASPSPETRAVATAGLS